MSRREPHWEIVQTEAGFHARFRASNGRIIVSSEVYKSDRGARRAIELVSGHVVELDDVGNWMVLRDCTEVDYVLVRHLDERTKAAR